MNIYQKELSQIQSDSINKNLSCTQLTTSYKDLLFDHILEIQNRSIHNKQNTNLVSKKVKKSDIFQKKNYDNNTQRSKLKQKLFLPNININLGSLSQFLSQNQQKRLIYTNKRQFFHQYLNRKRQQQSTQEIILKNKISQKNQQQKILLSLKSSQYQKKLASRIVVEKIFQSVYDLPLEQFTNSINTKTQIKSTNRININNLQNLLQCYESNQICVMKKSRKLLPKIHSIQDDKFNQTTLNKKNKKVFISYDKQTKLKILTQIKNRYYGNFLLLQIYKDLRKIQIPLQNQNFALLIQAQVQLDEQLKSIAESIIFNKRNSSLVVSARNSLLQSPSSIKNNKSILITQPINLQKRMKQVSQIFRRSKLKSIIYSDTIAKVTQQQIVFKKMQFKDFQMGLYMINYIKLQRIQIIKLQNIKIQTSLLFMFIDVLCKFASQINPLKQFSICSISIQNLNKFSQKVSDLFKQINIKKVCLNYTDIGSKEFTKICLGICQNSSIQEIQVRNNRIDYMGYKSLQSILKICVNLKRIDLRNNQISSLMNLKSIDQRVVV